MTNARLADQSTRLSDRHHQVTLATLLKVFAVVAVICFVLRIAYVAHLYEDDGLWFTAAEQIIRGKALYSDIYFDKPPGLALTYALLFRLLGPHVITIRLFTMAYALAI